MASAPIDPVELTRDLIRRPSVTPADEGAMDIIQARLEAMGFVCRRMAFEGIENLYARLGTASPNLCFAGHTDVVPTGPVEGWSQGPFEAEVVGGVLYGRGAVDMKGGIAAWIAALERWLAANTLKGSLSLLITGDEEGVALNGTKRVVQALIAEGEVIDACVVGEPSSALRLGDTIKVGRRGSLNTWISVFGKQGHVAYPDRAANPAPVLTRLLTDLCDRRLDEGYPPLGATAADAVDGCLSAMAFQPSNLEITTIDIGNPATNLIPGEAKARINIRFNPSHTGESLMAWLNERAGAAQAGSGLRVELEHLHSGDAFLTEAGVFVETVRDAVEQVAGVRPEPSTTGGTSDARFIRAMCPVLELGLVGQTMHQINERAPVAEIEQLARVYERVIDLYFQRFA